jgi:hypothetical protein
MQPYQPQIGQVLHTLAFSTQLQFRFQSIHHVQLNNDGDGYEFDVALPPFPGLYVIYSHHAQSVYIGSTGAGAGVRGRFDGRFAAYREMGFTPQILAGIEVYAVDPYVSYPELGGPILPGLFGTHGYTHKAPDNAGRIYVPYGYVPPGGGPRPQMMIDVEHLLIRMFMHSMQTGHPLWPVRNLVKTGGFTNQIARDTTIEAALLAFNAVPQTMGGRRFHMTQAQVPFNTTL